MSADDFIVTPWHVEGEIDYDKLIKQFGTQKLTSDILNKIKKIAGEDHFMLRRGIFFSHREMSRILQDYEKGKKFFLYTGRGPSGHTHIGHLVPWVFAKWLQEKFSVNMYFQLTDDEKFFSKSNLTLEQTQQFAYENALDFIALGFKPENTKIIINTKNIQTLYPIAAQVAKKINFSNTKATKPKPALIHNIMIPSLVGPGGKMSASDENSTIYTTDSPSVVKKKVNKYAFSGGQPDIEQHRKLGGNPDIDVSYQYLRIFFEPDDKKLKSIYDDYKSGKMLTGELKAILIEKINNFLKTHQEKREKAKSQLDAFLLKENEN